MVKPVILGFGGMFAYHVGSDSRREARLTMPESYYRHHLFFCVNVRDDGRPCCQQHDAARYRDYLKQRVKASGLAGPGKIRVNQAGCLDRCEHGPVLVVYPEGTWYHYLDEEDLDEIFEQHLLGGKPVARLLLPDDDAKRG